MTRLLGPFRSVSTKLLLALCLILSPAFVLAAPASASVCQTQSSYAYSIPDNVLGVPDLYQFGISNNETGCAASGFTATFTPFAIGAPFSCSGVTGPSGLAVCNVDIPLGISSDTYAVPESGGYLVDVVFYADFGSAIGTCDLGITFSYSQCNYF